MNASPRNARHAGAVAATRLGGGLGAVVSAVAAAILVLVCLLVVLPPAPAAAQLVQSRVDRTDPNEAEKPKPDPLARETPRGAVGGFVAALAANDMDRAAEYLDLSQIPVGERRSRGQRLAANLQTLLDRGGWLASPANLFGIPTGDVNDSFGAAEDVVGGVLTSRGVVDLIAARVERGDGPALWLISQATLAALPALLAQSRPSVLDRFLWQGLKSATVFGVPVGHWLAFGVIFLISLAIARILTGGMRRTFLALSRFKRDGQVLALSDAVLLPIGLILAVVLTRLGNFFLGVSVVARQYGDRLGNIVLWFAAAWLLWRAIDVVVETSRQRALRKGHVGALSALTLAGRTVKIALVAIALFAVLANFGFDVTTGLAALGIGGLALALGAQKTIENLVGSMTLVADHPLRIGDFCKIGPTYGTVEDIGMRSTRIRTLDRTILTVPNGELASLQIENFTQRDRFWLHHELAIRLDTPPARTRTLLKDLRGLLEIDPRLDPESNRVRVLRADRDAIAIEIFAYAFAADFNGFLEIQEEILFRVFETLRDNGVALALPAQALYLDQAGTRAISEEGPAPGSATQPDTMSSNASGGGSDGGEGVAEADTPGRLGRDRRAAG